MALQITSRKALYSFPVKPEKHLPVSASLVDFFEQKMDEWRCKLHRKNLLTLFLSKLTHLHLSFNVIVFTFTNTFQNTTGYALHSSDTS